MWDQPPDRIESWHLDAGVRQTVEHWFGAAELPAVRDGRRSVHLRLLDGAGRMIKIKGAGLDAGEVLFGQYRRTGPKALSFDFEGRAMDNIAMGHDGAQEGAASMQQAATEYRVSAELQAAGYSVVPCLGYGRIERDGQAAWFSVFDWQEGCTPGMTYPYLPMPHWIRLNEEIGPLLFDIASKQSLLGQCWYVMNLTTGQTWIKDLHPFVRADPVNMSQISWVMQFAYSLHIRALAAFMRLQSSNGDPAFPPDLHVRQYRPICPDVTPADHDDLSVRVVIPYMIRPAPGFRVEALTAVLRSNPITAALMEICPPEYQRP